MIKIDGSQGEGGGQILRSALTLSMATGQPFNITGIRAGRRRPGMMRQHLTSVEAAATVSNAEIEGAHIGSTSLTFSPRSVKAGDYRFTIASAGSSTLVFQTVAPVLLGLSETSHLHLEGGTHNSAAPCYDFIAQTFLPALERMGIAWKSEISRRGYYPAGGGMWNIELSGAQNLGSSVSSLNPLDLSQKVNWSQPEIRILLSRMAYGLVDREKRIIASVLNISEDAIQVEEDKNSIGPGNVILLTLRSNDLVEVVTGFAGFGGHTENVSHDAAQEALTLMESGYPVGLHLADQLLVALAVMGGGQFLTLPLTSHSRTNMDVIHQFIPGCIETSESESGCLVTVKAVR